MHVKKYCVLSSYVIQCPCSPRATLYLYREESGDKDSSSNASSCPFKRCTRWRALVIDASNSTLHNPSMLATLYPALGGCVVWAEFINKTGEHEIKAFVVQLKKEIDGKTIHLFFYKKYFKL